MCGVVFDSKQVKIRKAVKCWGCLDQYQKGELLTITKGVTDGSFWSCYYCPICWAFQKSKFFDWQDYDCEGIAPGDFKYNAYQYPAFREKFIEEFNKKQVLI